MSVNNMYGFMSPVHKEAGWMEVPPRQNFGGYGIGILLIDKSWYPFVPGNVVNAWTYQYPVRFKAVKNLDTPTLHSGAPEAYQPILEAAKELQTEGVRAIAGACGFFANFQQQLAADLDVPVAVSSMVQIPWIRTLLKPGQKIGMLTANAEALTDEVFARCGLTETSDLVIGNARYCENFRNIMEDKGRFDAAGVRNDVVGLAKTLVEENPDIGAILLECSDMPPYAWEIQRETKRPVFDFITLINWMQNAVQQRPYEGWI